MTQMMSLRFRLKVAYAHVACVLSFRFEPVAEIAENLCFELVF